METEAGTVLLFSALSFLFLFYPLYCWVVRRSERRDRAWSLFASLRGLERRERRRDLLFVGRNQGFPFALERTLTNRSTPLRPGSRIWVSHGEPRLVTRVRLFLPGLPRGVRVRRSTLKRRLFRWPGPPAISTGDPQFDRAFLVQGEDADEVRTWLTPQHRAALRAAADELACLEVDGQGLVVERRGQISRLQELESLYSRLGDLATRLADAPERPEEPRFEEPEEASAFPANVPPTPRLVVQIVLIAPFVAMSLVSGIVLSDLLRPRPRPAEPPRTARATQRNCFELWELHPDDSVRVVSVTEKPDVPTTPVREESPYLRPGDEVLALELIGASLSGRNLASREYGGQPYVVHELLLTAFERRWGYEMRLAHPPHLRAQGDHRLLSIGVYPTSARRRVIVVAIPKGERAPDVTDLRPYRTEGLDGWELLFYDVTAVQAHASIHVRFRPGADAPSLDWRRVDSLT